MSADSQDLINHLMIQMAQQQTGPSLYGLQAQADPNALQALLGKMKQQQVLDQANAPTPGPYGYLHDAGKAAFNSIGSNLGGQLAAFGNGPQQGPNPQIQAQRDAISAGNQGVSSDLAGGVDPEQAKINALTKAAQAGLPGAAQALDQAVEQQQKTMTAKAQAFKDTAQGNSAIDEIKARAAAQKHQAFEEGGQTWHYVTTNDGIAQYQNDHGEPKVVTVAPSKTVAGVSDSVDPAQVALLVKAIKEGRMKPIDPTGTFAKSPMGKAVMVAQASDTGIDATNYGTKIKTLKDFATGAEGKQVTSFNVAQSHLDTLKDAAAGLDNNDLPAANKVLNSLGVQAGGTAQAAFAATKSVVANEIIKTIVPGQSAESDRQEVQNQITAAQTPAQLKAVIDKYQELMSGKLAGLRQQYEQGSGRSDFEAKLSKRAIELARKSPSYTAQFPAPGAKAAAAPPASGQVVDFGSLK